MNILSYLNPLTWLDSIKKNIFGGKLTKMAGSFVRTWLAAGFGTLAGLGIITGEQAQELAIAFNPIIDGLIGLAFVQIWSLVEKAKK